MILPRNLERVNLPQNFFGKNLRPQIRKSDWRIPPFHLFRQVTGFRIGALCQCDRISDLAPHTPPENNQFQ